MGTLQLVRGFIIEQDHTGIRFLQAVADNKFVITPCKEQFVSVRRKSEVIFQEADFRSEETINHNLYKVLEAGLRELRPTLVQLDQNDQLCGSEVLHKLSNEVIQSALQGNDGAENQEDRATLEAYTGLHNVTGDVLQHLLGFTIPQESSVRELFNTIDQGEHMLGQSPNGTLHVFQKLGENHFSYRMTYDVWVEANRKTIQQIAEAVHHHSQALSELLNKRA